MKNRYNLALCTLLLTTITAFSQWAPIQDPYSNFHVYELKQKDSLLFAGTECGLFVRNISGSSWRHLTTYSTPRIEVKGDSLFTFSSQALGILNIASSPLKVNFHTAGSPYFSTPSFALHDTMMFSGSFTGVHVSHDFGVTSQPYLPGLPMDTFTNNGNTYYSLSVFDVITTSNHVFCASAKGVYRSDFNLTGWTLKNNGLNGTSSRSMHSYSNKLYALGLDSLYVSSDDGDTWASIFGSSSQLVRDFCEASGELYLTNGSLGVLKSSDNGLTWQAISTGISGHVHGLDYVNNALHALSSEGIFRWDGSSWQMQVDDGLLCTSIASIQATSTNVIVIDWEGVYRLESDNTYTDITPRSGPRWTYGYSSLRNDTLYIPANYSATSSGVDSTKVFYTSDNGSSWKMMDGPGFSNSLVRNTEIRFYADTMYLLGNGELFYTIDQGQSWTDISMAGFNCIGEIFYLEGKLYMTDCNQGWVYRRQGNGNLWIRDMGLPSGKNLLFMERDSAIFLASENKIIRKYPSSNNWTLATNGLGQFDVYSYFNHNQNLFITTSEGVFRTEDYGNLWIDFNDGWPEPGLMFPVSMAVLGDTLYAGTYNRGVYKRAVPANPVSLEEDHIGNPVRVFPNPTADVCTISLPNEKGGTFKIADQGGKVLMEGNFKSNEPVRLHNLNSGLYLMLIESEGKSFQQKLIIQR